MTKYTPGPWWMAATGEADGVGFDIGAGNCAIGYAQDRADALLMKHAPDLLKALTDLVAMCGQFVEDYDEAKWVPIAINKAREVIAKAEGRQ